MTSLKVAGEGGLQTAGLDLSTEEALETLGQCTVSGDPADSMAPGHATPITSVR